MAYENNSPLVYSRVAAAPTALTATGVLAPGFIANKNVQLAVAQFRVTTAIVSTGAVVITLKKRVLPNSSSGEVVIGTLSIPAGAVAGAVYYRTFDEDLAANTFRPGDELVYEVTTASAGGGAAGAGIPLPEFWEHPQAFADDALMIKITA